MLKKTSFLALIMLSLVLVGCAPKGPTTNFKAQYYPECFDPIDRLCKDQDNTAKMKSAGAGALLGGLTGAVIGAATTGKWQGALAGAAIGAAAGGVAGYAYQHIKEIKDQNERLEAYKAQFGKEAEDLNLQKASVLSAYKCYQEQIKRLKEGMKNGSIKKDEAKARIAEISKGLEELKKFWDDRSTQFAAQQQEADNIMIEEEKKATTAAAKKRLAQVKKQRLAAQKTREAGDKEVSNESEKASIAIATLTESITGTATL